MARYVFDIETDGLLDKMTVVHSLVLQDVDTGDVISASSENLDIKDTLSLLMKADQIIGHNIIGFDIPAIKKVYPWFKIDESKVHDTLVMSRLLWADLFDKDYKLIVKEQMPKQKRGSHGLEAWGYRLGEWKGDYSAEMKAKGLDPWASWNKEMQVYCEQDVRVNLKLLELIESKTTDPRAVELEHRIAWICWRQEQNGFVFDYDKALDLLRDLSVEKAGIESSLQHLFDPWWVADKEVKVPARDMTYKSLERHSVWKGAAYQPVKLNVFNPGSRAHIADRLQKIRGWQPKDFTANGQPKIDDEILGALPYPEAKKIAHYLTLQKRIGMIAEGPSAWLTKYNKDTGRMHGRVTTNGAVTGRMTHQSPNVAQVPSVKSLYGNECRELWTVGEGKKLVGVDVSGLELRMLAHYMNDPDYSREVVDGDVHTANMKAAGLSDRNQAKTFIYAFLYGAGNEKIGSVVGKGPGAGSKLKKKFLAGLPALDKLITGVKTKAADMGYIKGLDGRHIHVRHAHASLNTLLQSAGALVCKRWAVECEDEIRRRGWGHKVLFVANVHDEIQFEVDEDVAEEWAEVAVDCIVRAGNYFGIRVPLTGEANIGSNWKETH